MLPFLEGYISLFPDMHHYRKLLFTSRSNELENTRSRTPDLRNAFKGRTLVELQVASKNPKAEIEMIRRQHTEKHHVCSISISFRRVHRNNCICRRRPECAGLRQRCEHGVRIA